MALPDVEPGYVVLASRASIETFFRLKYEGLKAAGVPRLRVAVTQAKATAEDKLVAAVVWYYLEPGGTRAGATSARYFLERHCGGMTVQMIEFERVGFPLLVSWFQQAGRPASHPPSDHIH